MENITKLTQFTIDFIGGIVTAVAIIIGVGVFLSIPYYGWIGSFIAGALVAGLRIINWPIKIVTLILWGPVLAIFGHYIVWRIAVPFSIIQAAICWIAFAVAFYFAYNHKKPTMPF